MKKLLSLLSVLTISGTSLPTTIAASPYQKEEKLSSNINLQINNLEKLNRAKREKIYDYTCAQKLIAGVGGGDGVASGAEAGAGIGAASGAAIGAVFGTIFGFFTGVGVGGAVGGTVASNSASTVCAKEIGEFILNNDLKIIGDDNTILKELKKINQSLNIDNLYVTNKNNTSAKIVASSSSNYKTESYVIVKFINQRHLNWTADLLKNWSYNYNKWINELNRQVKEDVPSLLYNKKNLKRW